ncbi:hypothetical protein LLG96_11360 [bacterium]|nr:hypothetical protein [bacterium]
MTDQTQASLVGKTYDTAHLFIDRNDRVIIRELAARTAELAARPDEDRRRDLWYRHNALHETRPLVFCDPENGWNEIIRGDDLKCGGQLAREWEMTLRKEIFWADSMGDDRVCESCFTIPHVYTETDWGVHETKTGGSDGGSYVWESPLKSYDDMNKLRFPRIEVDYEATAALQSLAVDVLGDFLTVRLKGKWWWTLGMTWTLVNLRGLCQVMYDVYDNPEMLHVLMGFLRDGHLARLQFLENNGLLSLNNDGTYVGSGGFGWTTELPLDDFDGTGVRTCDMWGFAESQETTTWSPDMFEEFIFPYQLPILERFGLNCYGCCEPLDRRWHIIEKIPRLRRVSVSPWANPAVMAEQLGKRYIFSLKPNPAHLAVPFMDEDFVRTELRKTLKVIGDCHVEIIMKDNHTIGNNPENVRRWCKIAREESEALV